MITAKVVADSISRDGIRLTTIETYAPKFIDAEFEKHRMLSSNSSSSRAIPFGPLKDVYIPQDIRKAQKGMQGYEKVNFGSLAYFRVQLKKLYEDALFITSQYPALIHKQHLNRYLEPWMMQKKIVTATEWDNFFTLRLAPNAQPEIQELAWAMKTAMDNSEPKVLQLGEWHLPYVGEDEGTPEVKRKLSVARCARVSYNNHDGSSPNAHNDIKLYWRLLNDHHMTPFEHQSTPMIDSSLWEIGEDKVVTGPANWEKGVSHVDKKLNLWSANFRGWIQHRKFIE